MINDRAKPIYGADTDRSRLRQHNVSAETEEEAQAYAESNPGVEQTTPYRTAPVETTKA